MNRIENEPRPRRNLWITAGAIALAVPAFLAFVVFGVQTLFVDDVVAESGPVFDEVIDSAPTTTINDTNAADGATASTAALPGAASTSTTPASTAPVTAPQPAAIASGTFKDRRRTRAELAVLLLTLAPLPALPLGHVFGLRTGSNRPCRQTASLYSQPKLPPSSCLLQSLF